MSGLCQYEFSKPQFRGSIATVRRMGEVIAAERGVSYGHINIIPVDQIAE